MKSCGTVQSWPRLQHCAQTIKNTSWVTCIFLLHLDFIHQPFWTSPCIELHHGACEGLEAIRGPQITLLTKMDLGGYFFNLTKLWMRACSIFDQISLHFRIVPELHLSTVVNAILETSVVFHIFQGDSDCELTTLPCYSGLTILCFSWYIQAGQIFQQIFSSTEFC